jgi:spermidine synthase
MTHYSTDAAAGRPYVHDTPEARTLHFAELDLQSRMLKADPIALALDYTRTMMGFLLFVSRPRRLAMIGLGGGSLAKFCHHELPDTRIDVIEINPRVVALRDLFGVPADDARFRIHVDDGARFVAQADDCYDAILVDGYTHDGIPQSLASHRFHRDCRQALRASGVLVSNLHGPEVGSHVARIRRLYRDQVVCLDETTCTNRILFAFKGNAAGRTPAPALDAALLDTPRLRALLPTILARFAQVPWPQRASVARA